MKLSLLHETTLVGAIAIKPGFHVEDGTPEVFRPRTNRWYLAFANDDYSDELLEDKDSGLKKSTIQFGDQTSRPKKLVWQPEEGQGHELTNPGLYAPKGTKFPKRGYHWPRTSFHGQSEGHAEHTLGGFK